MKRLRNFVGGQIGIPLAVVLTGVTLVISGFTSYFTSEIRTQAQVMEVRTDLSKDIYVNGQRISTLEEAVRTIKESQLQTQKDVKEILRLLK